MPLSLRLPNPPPLPPLLRFAKQISSLRSPPSPKQDGGPLLPPVPLPKLPSLHSAPSSPPLPVPPELPFFSRRLLPPPPFPLPLPSTFPSPLASPPHPAGNFLPPSQ